MDNDRISESKAPKPPPAPPNISTDALWRDTFWWQKWEVYERVYTPGVRSVEELCRYVGLPSNLSGKHVIDIGAWNGCYSFECERRGSEEVVAYSLEDPEESGFNRLKEHLGSKVNYIQGSLYTL